MPIENIYAIVYFDAIHFKVRQDGRVITKAAYTVMGMTLDGRGDLLGIWIGEAESSKFWLQVCSALEQRGVEDILIACMDGLKGLPAAIQSVFPKARIQLCIIHMIRNSLRYIPNKHRKDFTSDLKKIYRAESEEAGLRHLNSLEEKWGRSYPAAVTPWRAHWDHLSTFFDFPEDLRRVIYTTNAVESIHRQVRKVTKSKSIFPNDSALVKMLYLSITKITNKWLHTPRNWAGALSSLAIIFEERVTAAKEA